MSTPSPYCQTLEPPQYVYWYHNDKIINYDTKRTRVSFDLGEDNLIKSPSHSHNRVGIHRRKHEEDEQPLGDCLGAEVWQRQLHLQVNNVIENYLNPIKPCTFWTLGVIGSMIHLYNANRNCIDNYLLIIHRENVIKDVCFQHHPCRAQYHLCICQPRWVCICVWICICYLTYAHKQAEAYSQAPPPLLLEQHIVGHQQSAPIVMTMTTMMVMLMIIKSLTNSRYSLDPVGRSFDHPHSRN